MYATPAATCQVQSIESASKTAFVIFSTVVIGTGSIYGFDRANTWRQHIQPRVPFTLDGGDSASSNRTERAEVRTASEHLSTIRSVLNPTVVDLATIFDVSRQTVYKWLAGNATPEEDKAERIRSLSLVAEELHAAGIQRAGSLLKMKAFSGRSLMDLFMSGEICNDHTSSLILEAKAMDKLYRQTGLETTKSRPSSDWKASISIPGSAETGL